MYGLELEDNNIDMSGETVSNENEWTFWEIL